MAAFWTCAVDDAILQNIMPGALNKKVVALGTVCARCAAENISFVDVMQANFASDLARAMQCFRRRARLVTQFEVGMKRGEVQRNVGAEMLQNPLGELARFRFVVVQSGDH